jgi:hypothetical protein
MLRNQASNMLRKNSVYTQDTIGVFHIGTDGNKAAGCSNWFVLFIWFIWSIWFNQTNEVDQTNQITFFLRRRPFSASC